MLSLFYLEAIIKCREWIESGMKRCVGELKGRKGVSEYSRSESIEMVWACGKNG